jgi:hypothetical protein
MPTKRLCIGAIATVGILKGLGASEALTNRLARRVAAAIGLSPASPINNDGGSMTIDPAISTNDGPPRSLEELLGRLSSGDLGTVYGSDGTMPRIEQAEAESAFRRAKLFSLGIPFADPAL